MAIHHPDDQVNIGNFNIQVVSLFKKPLTRQKTEAVKIESSNATHRMNSKAKHRQPPPTILFNTFTMMEAPLLFISSTRILETAR